MPKREREKERKGKKKSAMPMQFVLISHFPFHFEKSFVLHSPQYSMHSYKLYNINKSFNLK